MLSYFLGQRQQFEFEHRTLVPQGDDSDQLNGAGTSENENIPFTRYVRFYIFFFVCFKVLFFIL